MYQLTHVEQTTLLGSSPLSSAQKAEIAIAKGSESAACRLSKNVSNEEQGEGRGHEASVQTDEILSEWQFVNVVLGWLMFALQDLGYSLLLVSSFLLAILTVVSPCSNDIVSAETQLNLGLATVICSALTLQTCSLLRQFRHCIMSSIKPGVEQTMVNAIEAEKGALIKRKVVKKSVVRYMNAGYYGVIIVIHALMAIATLVLSILVFAEQKCSNPTPKQYLEYKGRHIAGVVVCTAAAINIAAYESVYFIVFFTSLKEICHWICTGGNSKYNVRLFLPLTVAMLNYHGYKAKSDSYNPSRADNFDDTDALCCVSCSTGFTHVVTQLPLRNCWVSAIRIAWREVEEETDKV